MIELRERIAAANLWRGFEAESNATPQEGPFDTLCISIDQKGLD